MHRDTIVIGGSAGSIDALTRILAELPAKLPASVFVVVHLSPTSTSALPSILARAAILPARHVQASEPIQPGTIYVAPPDRHLVLIDGVVTVNRGPRENRVRPAVDVLFRSAVRARGRRVIGVVLSGGLDDGAAGLALIKRSGGCALVQDPAEAPTPSMPAAAIARTAVDAILPAAAIGAALLAAVEEDMSDSSLDRDDPVLNEAELPPGTLSCPECMGVLHEHDIGGGLLFECRIGHKFSQESMLSAQADGVETALWVAVRALEERTELTRRMAERFRANGHMLTAGRLARESHEAAEEAELVRRLVESGVVAQQQLESPWEGSHG